MVNIGAANEILTTVANGRFLNAVKIDNKAMRPNKHLLKCSNGLSVAVSYTHLTLPTTPYV